MTRNWVGLASWVLGVGVLLAGGCDWLEPTPMITEVVLAEAEVAVVDPAPVVVEEVAAPVPVVPEPVKPPPAPVKPPPPRPKNAYQGLIYDIDLERQALARRKNAGEDVLAETAATLRKRLPELMNVWKGTRYSYNGTSTVPKTGKIACGYFVSVVLLHAGFEIDRVDLARQPSEQIIRTVVPDPSIERFSFVTRDKIVKRVEQMGEGVYLAGLDTHIGFLVRKEGKPVEFCHSTSRQRKIGVICEAAKTSKSFASRYTVIGKLEEPPLLQAWLDGASLAAARKGRPQPEVLIEKLPPLPFGLFEL